MYIRMNKAFSYKDEAGTKITAPRGWVGELPDDVAREAINGGFAVDGNERSATPVVQEVPKTAGSVEPLDSMTKEELLAEAEKRGVEVKSNMAKAEILEALKKAA
jgi:aminopeptidase N